MDQAEGLRRLLGGNALRIITVASATPGAGKTTAVINLAVALARTGRDVLILDESPRYCNVTGMLGIAARYDLLHVINRQRTLAQVLVAGAQNVSVLPAARGVARLAGLDRDDQDRLIECFSGLPKSIDVVLVDAASGGGSKALPASLAAQDVVLVLSGTSSSITDNYALIKTLSSQYARRHFRILVNKVRSERRARAIFLNMAQAARRYLAVSLDDIGCIPPDERIERAAALCTSVVEAFPDAPSATGFRRMAREMMRWPGREESQQSIENFMQRLIQSSRLAAAGIGI